MDTRNSDARVRPLHLTVMRNLASLTVSLSDLRSIAIVESVTLHADLLEELARSIVRLCELPIHRGSQVADVGGIIFSKLLPARVGATLSDSVPRELHLQLSESVAGVAWELAYDGNSFLGAKFSVSRHIVSGEEVAPSPAWIPLEGVCRVSLLSGELRSAQTDAYQHRILAALGKLSAFSVTHVNVAELGRDDLHDLLDTSDIAHYVGSLGRPCVPITEMAAHPHPPRLLVCEQARDPDSAEAAAQLCAKASQAGLNVFIREVRPSHASSVDFIADFYRHVASGITFAKAAQLARARSATRPDVYGIEDLLARYCGDGTLAAFARNQFNAGDDNLRQVTIMSHDLVSSTQLIAQLGAEEYSELLGRYHRLCARIVRRHGGISDDPQGDDGIMCYFGVPLADEDASAQSMRAALEIVDAVAELGVSVRVGISTGRVVIRSGQPVGVAVHLAARLQSIAEPGTVVVGDATQRLTQGRFEFEPVASVLHLKGIDEPVAAFRVTKELGLSNSDRLDSALRLTPFIGRDREFAVLEEHWRTTCRGAAQAVVVTGDAGIGKSRLLREFRSSLSTRGTPTIECRCSPHHTSSAFYPVIGWLNRLLEIQDQDAPEVRLSKIERSAVSTLGIDDAATAVAALLSVPLEGLRPPPKRSAEKQRQLTLDVLVRWIVKTVQAGPLCLIIEDVQWLDPSSREFLDRLIARASAMPLMTILTLRTETP